MARRLARTLPLLVLVLALAVPASVSASTTVGSGNLGSDGSTAVGCDPPPAPTPCVTIQDTIDGTFVTPPTGVITSWSVRNAAGTIALRVLRPRDGEYEAGELHATNISEGNDETGAGADVVQTFDTRQPVQAGDYFGITLQSGSAIGAFAGATTTHLFEVDGDLNLDNVDDDSPQEIEQLLQVEVEPDADGDGYGDETQDGCPSDASTAGACPEPPVPPEPVFDPFADVRVVGPKTTVSPRSITAAKDGSVKFTVANEARVPVKGTVTLSSTAAQLSAKKRVNVGSKRISIGAADSTTVKIKLSRKARRALKRRKKLALNATTTVKAEQGKSSKRTTKLTVKQPKKAKKKPRRRSGGGGGGGRWNARNLERSGSLGAFSFSLRNGQITVLKPVLVTVTCFEMGGPFGSAFSFEPFMAKGPYTLGQKTEISEKHPALNPLVSSGERNIRYTLDSRRSGRKIVGELKISYTSFRFSFNNDFYTILCSGSDKFEASPA